MSTWVPTAASTELCPGVESFYRKGTHDEIGEDFVLYDLVGHQVFPTESPAISLEKSRPQARHAPGFLFHLSTTLTPHPPSGGRRTHSGDRLSLIHI